MRARPALPLRRFGGPIALFTTPWTAEGTREWERLTTCSAESCLRGCSRGLAGVGASLSDDLVDGFLVGVVAVGVGDAAVQVVESIAGAEGRPVIVVVFAHVTPDVGYAGGSARPGTTAVATGAAV